MIFHFHNLIVTLSFIFYLFQVWLRIVRFSDSKFPFLLIISSHPVRKIYSRLFIYSPCDLFEFLFISSYHQFPCLNPGFIVLNNLFQLSWVFFLLLYHSSSLSVFLIWVCKFFFQNLFNQYFLLIHLFAHLFHLIDFLSFQSSLSILLVFDYKNLIF